MEQAELARENHLFLVTQVPNCLFGEDFQGALGAAYALMKDIRNDEGEPRPDDFCHCGFESGYVGITAPAAEVIRDKNVDTFNLASALYSAFKSDADRGEVNDRVTVSVKGHSFIFLITDYETDDPEYGWIDVTKNPLLVPSGQIMHRRVIIGLAN